MKHDAYHANLLRQEAFRCLDDGDLNEALAAAGRAIEYPRRTLARNPADAQALYDWAEGLMARAVVRRNLGTENDLWQGLGDYDTAAQVMSAILEQFPMKENWSAYAAIHHNRGNLRQDLGDLCGALEDANIAIRTRQRHLASVRQEQGLLAGSLKLRSTVYLMLGEVATAIEAGEAAVQMRRSRLTAGADPAKQQTFAMTLFTLASALSVAGDIDRAGAAIGEAIEILEALLSRNTVSPTVATDLEMCTKLRQRINKGGDRPVYERAAIKHCAALEKDPTDDTAWQLLGRTYSALGKRRSALTCFSAARRFSKNKYIEKEAVWLSGFNGHKITSTCPPWEENTYFVPALARLEEPVRGEIVATIAQDFARACEQIIHGQDQNLLVSAINEITEICKRAKNEFSSAQTTSKFEELLKTANVARRKAGLETISRR